MRKHRRGAGLIVPALLLLCSLSGPARSAPASIVVDADLLANAEALKVDYGVAWVGHTSNYKFGVYSIVSSKRSPDVTRTTGTLFNPIGREHTRHKYEFVIRGADAAATAKVKAVQNVEAADIPDLDLGGGFGIDLESIVGEVDDLAASIAPSDDPQDTWLLLLNVQRRLAGMSEETRMSLLQGAGRDITITAVTSDQPGAKPASLPARGYQFTEEGRAIAALQYLGGGALGLNKSVVYLRRDVDSRTRLVLAAAATAIMEAKINALDE